MKQDMGNYRANILKKNKLASDSVVKAFFITAEEISLVRKEGRRIEEVQVCKESLPTASTCVKIAQVQKVGKMNCQTVAKFAIVQREGIYKKVRQRWTYSNGSRSSFVSENDGENTDNNVFVSKNDSENADNNAFVSENDSKNNNQL